MKRILFTCFVSLVSICAIAQIQDTIPSVELNLLEVDYQEIEESIKNKKSEFYYPNLMNRYEACDSTLTREELSHLYHGYIFQPEYSPQNRDRSKVAALIKEQKYQEAIGKGMELLAKNPFDLDLNYYTFIAMFKAEKDRSEMDPFFLRYSNLKDMIAWTGNGVTPATAFKVIRVSDEYHMMRHYFEIKEIKKQTLVGSCDKFEIEMSEYYFLNEIFFDITPSLNYIQKALGE